MPSKKTPKSKANQEVSCCSVNSYHLLNTCRESPGVYSCAIDSFIELCFYNFYPLLTELYPNLTPFFLMIHDCCKKYSEHTLSAVPRINFVYELLSMEVRQPIWDFVISKCNSFHNRDGNAEFSEIFRQIVFGDLNLEEVSTFVTRCTFDRFCNLCNIQSPGFEEIFLHYVNNINPSLETVKQWPKLLVDFNNLIPLCPSCSQQVVISNFVIKPSNVLFVEFSPNLMDIVEFHESLMLHNKCYNLSGLVRNCSGHFAVAVKFKNIWIYIDDLQLTKQKFCSFAQIKKCYEKGWFFCCFVDSNIRVENMFSHIVDDSVIDFEIIKNIQPPLRKVSGNKSKKQNGNKSKRQKLEKDFEETKFKDFQYFQSVVPSLDFPRRGKRIMNKFFKCFDELKIEQCIICKEAWFDVSKGKCTRCKRDKKLPAKFSMENSMVPSPVPPELQELSQVEEMLIARAFPIMNIYCKSRGGQRAYKGHVITMPTNVQVVANTLPNIVEELPIIRLSSSDGNFKSKDFRVRRQKVLCALQWLVRFNPCYRTVNIDGTRIDKLPIDDLVEPVRQISLQTDQSLEQQLPVDQGPLPQPERDSEMSTFLPLNPNSRKQKDVLLEAATTEFEFVGESPLNEFSTELLATMAFPTLFPDGKGDPTNSAIIRDISNSNLESFALKIKHLLKFGEIEEGVWKYRFTSHPRFCYWAFNILYRQRLLSKGNLYIKRNPGEVNFTFDEFNEMVRSNSSNMFSKIFYYTKELTGSNSYWNRVRQDLRATIEQVGAPTIFFTLSMAEFHWPDLRKLFNLSDNASSQDLLTMIKDNPHIIVWYFQNRTEKFVKYWLYEYLGACWHWFRYEFAALRGSVHCHGLAKLKNDPGLVELSKLAILGHIAKGHINNPNCEQDLDLLGFDIQNGEEAEKTICEYIDNLLTTINPIEPSLWSSPKVHPCKRDFFSAMSPDVCFKDHVELVNSVQKHTCSTLYCLRQKGNELVCRFKYPFEESAKTHLEFTKVHTKDNSIKYRVEVKTARNDPRLNRYQRVQLQGWRANCDISAIVDYQSCLEYLTKYASKPESMSSIVKDALKHVSNSVSESDFDAIKTVKKLMMQTVGLRDMSVQEVCHQLLKIKLHSSSFEVITASLDGSRRIENVGGEFVNHLSHLDIYSSRIELSDLDVSSLNFIDFHSNYCYSNHSIVKRKKSVIVRTVPRISSFAKGVDYGKYCKLQLIKYRVWSNSVTSAWSNREPSDETFIQEWMTFLQTDYARACVHDYSFELDNLQEVLCQDDDETTSLIESDGEEQEEWMILSALADTSHSNDRDNMENIFHQDYWLDQAAQYSFEEISDMKNWIITKKSSFIINTNEIPSNESQNISKLNFQQRKVFDIIIDHFQSVNSDQLLMLVTGKAGSGKSFLIDRIRNALGNKCQVSAMFGIAAFNVKGKTLHYLLKLPIRGKRKKELNGQPLIQVQDIFENISYLIIDEYSVISQSDLAWINRRCKQATGKQDLPFGGINIILFGDLGQLPPVIGSVLYSQSLSNELDCEGMLLYSLFQRVVVLDQNQRINNDYRFSQLLEHIRDGNVTESDWELLLQHTPQVKGSHFTNALKLSYGKKEVAEKNYEALKKLNNPIAEIKAVHNKTEAAKCSLDDMEGLAPTLLLSVGARVMLTRNLWTDVGLVNGALGVVHSILYKEDNTRFPVAVIVKFDNYTGPSVFTETENCVPIPPSTSFSESYGPMYERTQYPLKLSWAITIHKSQGLTLDQAWVNLGFSERTLGMSYVALSRVRCLNDLLIEPVSLQRLNSIVSDKKKAAKVNKRITTRANPHGNDPLESESQISLKYETARSSSLDTTVIPEAPEIVSTQFDSQISPNFETGSSSSLDTTVTPKIVPTQLKSRKRLSHDSQNDSKDITSPASTYGGSSSSASVDIPPTKRLFTNSPTPYTPSSPKTAVDIVGYVASVTPTMKNQAKTSDYFFAYIKTEPTTTEKILVSNHRNMKIVRQKILDAFHDKTPISACKVNPSHKKDVYYFNAYSFINDVSEMLTFNINDADAVNLSDIQDEGLVLSIVGEIRFSANETQKSYFKNGKFKSDRMREAVISDGTRTVKLTIWGFLIDIIKDNTLLQLINVSSRIFNEEIVLTTNYSSSVVYLTETMEIEFDPLVYNSEYVNEEHSGEFRLCCPSIKGIKIDSFSSCNNCKSRLTVKPGTGLSACTKCNRDFLTANQNNCKLVKIDLVKFEEKMTVTVYEDVLKEFLKSDLPGNDDELRVKLLNLNKVDFDILHKQFKVKAMLHHDG